MDNTYWMWVLVLSLSATCIRNQFFMIPFAVTTSWVSVMEPHSIVSNVAATV